MDHGASCIPTVSTSAPVCADVRIATIVAAGGVITSITDTRSPFKYCPAGTGNLADPGANGIIRRTSLNVTAAATGTDVVGLFTSCSGTQYLGADAACHTATGSGTVTSFSAGDLSPLFTTTEATATTTPALTFTLSNFAAHTFFGNNTVRLLRREPRPLDSVICHRRQRFAR